jgi:hypothetical protein
MSAGANDVARAIMIALLKLQSEGSIISALGNELGDTIRFPSGVLMAFGKRRSQCFLV